MYLYSYRGVIICRSIFTLFTKNRILIFCGFIMITDYILAIYVASYFSDYKNPETYKIHLWFITSCEMHQACLFPKRDNSTFWLVVTYNLVIILCRLIINMRVKLRYFVWYWIIVFWFLTRYLRHTFAKHKWIIAVN